MVQKRLLMIVGIFGLSAILVVSLPVNQTKADHCHPSQSQTVGPAVPSMPARPGSPVGTRTSSIERQRAPVSVPSLENKLDDAGTPTLKQLYSRDFPMVILAIGEAVKAIEAGDRQKELLELRKAVDMLAGVHKTLGAHVRPEFANSLRCPIMGSPIDPDEVEEQLTRDYRGRKIALCCSACPSEWDKLTDAQKQARVPGLRF